MPLSWPEIKARALKFSDEWKDEESESAEAKTFLNEFFEVFGIKRRRVATFELHVKSVGGKTGFIDLLWKSKILIEFKSAGKNLDRAYKQAIDYFPGLKEHQLPRYILVCDFKNFRLYDLETDDYVAFALVDFHKHIRLFGFIAGYTSHAVVPQDPVNARAAEQMGRLHDLLRSSGYVGHPLELLLVRLLFCMFADDTGIFEPVQSFHDWVDNSTNEDGANLGAMLSELFQVLNTPVAARQAAQKVAFESFPYVNGKLFQEALPIPAFDMKMRTTLLKCCALDWSAISPAIFGAIFQSIMDAKARRHLGAHYTSEENILKVVRPLFLDDLHSEFEQIKKSYEKRLKFHAKLRALAFLDPACGCGNFLVICYRELRLLEMKLLRESLADAKSEKLFTVHDYTLVDVDQFFGIEIEEFPAQIAQVAMWLIDHQMNVRASEEFGEYFARIPLKTTPHIVNGNALRIDWTTVVSPERKPFILGNPPFIGSKLLSDSQRQDVAAVAHNVVGSKSLDYVAAWYFLAARFAKGTTIKCALVSTNSITQGEQAGLLWNALLGQGIIIAFAYRTFRWTNEGRGVAAVHCVVIGFGYTTPVKRTIFEYDTVGQLQAITAKNINPYLVDAADINLPSRGRPLSPGAPEIGIGNKPIDDGNYLFTPDERLAFIKVEPAAAMYFRRWVGANEFLNRVERWCLWLGDCTPAELRAMPHAMARVASVQAFRAASLSAPTKALANTPTRFHVENMPAGEFLVFPRHSSETRRYVPLGFETSDVLVGDACLMSTSASLYDFGILSSEMHNAWVRYTCGRLKSDFRYSKDIVYNNFPWPTAPTAVSRSRVEEAAQGVLDARKAFKTSSLADLYDPTSMPAALAKAHGKLNAAVEKAYGTKRFADDAERVAYLFGIYESLDAALLAAAKAEPKRKLKPLTP